MIINRRGERASIAPEVQSARTHLNIPSGNSLETWCLDPVFRADMPIVQKIAREFWYSISGMGNSIVTTVLASDEVGECRITHHR